MQRALYNFIALTTSLLWMPVIILAKSRNDGVSKVCANRILDWVRWMCIYSYMSLYCKLYMIFFHFHSPPFLHYSFGIYTSFSLSLTKIQFQAFSMWKPWQSDFRASSEKWLNLTTIVFYDNLCFHVPGLLLYQLFFFFLNSKYEQFHISALAENKSL